jgi:hypothetical protein
MDMDQQVIPAAIIVAFLPHSQIISSFNLEKRKKKLSKAVYGTSHIVSLDEARHIYEDGAKRLLIGAGRQGLVKLSALGWALHGLRFEGADPLLERALLRHQGGVTTSAERHPIPQEIQEGPGAGALAHIEGIGGLALGVGMVVDNANIVIENIMRHRQLGKPFKEALIEGTSEMTSRLWVLL